MNIVFMGTPDFAVPSLVKLMDAGQQLVGVVTVPDKPAKRGQKLQSSSVKAFARSKGLPVLQPQQLNDPVFLQQLTDWSADLFIVVAFRILPEEVLKIPRLGAVNLHASLLPKYRGAAPINWALIHGETETGVTTFFIDKNIDTGEILLQQKVSITPEMTAGELHDILADVGSDLVVRTAAGIEAGNLVAIRQSGEPTRAPKLTKEMEKIDWTLRALN
ncbi:MAG: methionyl-tRNA formyltransferase [Calditrichaeota bacterium]|nr:MAG: methionyl-tRNA formyltransferase [Calditrichota bacterium]